MITEAMPESEPIDLARYVHAVRAAQLKMVLARIPTVLWIELVFSNAFIVALLWGGDSAKQIAGWFSVHFAVDLAIAYFYFTNRGAQNPVQIKSASIGLVLGMFLLGAYWGTLLAHIYVAVPELLHHINTFLFLTSLNVLAMMLLSDYLPAFLAFILPSTAMLSARSMLSADVNLILLGAMGAFATFIIFLVARSKNGDVVESLGLRFAMSDLAQELREQRDEANRANIAKSKFLAAASHDLRQPLHALTLFTSALESCENIKDVGSIASNIQGTVDSLEKLFNALLDISRLDAGVLHPQLQHFDLDGLLRRISSEYALEAELKGIGLTYEPCSFVALSDPLLLERILRNYLANAVRYTAEGGVCLYCKPTEEGLQIVVADTGVGIAPMYQEEIFDEFYQLDNPERDRSKGMGLGLAIVRRIADLLGHAIDVESVCGEGARFSVTVPEGSADQIVQELQLEDDPRQRLVGLRVVVIDDDMAVRESMRTVLALWGCQLVVASDENEAVAAARQQFDVPDVLLVDYRLRDGRTGIQAIARLRNEFAKDIPALILSGDTAPERLREVAESGHVLMHKPVQPTVLRGFLLRTLQALRVN